MAIFKKKASKEAAREGARSPTASPSMGQPAQQTQSMTAAARNVSDSYQNTQIPAPSSTIPGPRRKNNSISTAGPFGAPENRAVQQNTGRLSPVPGGPGYPVGMGLPSTMQPAMQPGPQSAIPPNGATTSPPLSALPPGASQSSNVPPAPVNPGYPWSTRPLRPYQQQTNPPSPPITPFPRYGFSVPPYPSHSGHILLFGGLVRDRAHNDLWSLDVRDCSLQLVKTRGDAPLPRIGHVSAIADRIMLVFGGDTKINEDDQQDDGLYVLDLRTQEWTQVPVLAGPSGRYGHAACMLGGYFYVHGGHVDGRNLDDLWSFDIRQLGQGSGPYKWERVSYTNPAPLARTGHTLVPYRNQLYLFGGTDGDYHYNDSWSLDIASGVWTELECIGYIPIPREGHAAAIVDDVVYVFGGRDVHGKDLGDLAAFRISNQRWYMFQNMGPAPMAKSGHSLCAAHGKVFVIGGESNQSPQIQRDDPNLVHVLDTTKIKYPTDQNVPRRGRTTSETTDLRSGPGQSPYGQHGGPGANQQFPAGSRSVDNIGRSMSPPSIGSEPRPLVIANDTTGNQQSKHAPRSESNDSHSGGNRAANGAVVAGAAGMAGAATAAAAAAGMAPQRPKREDDDEYRRAMSPSTNTNGTDSSTPPADRIVTPIGPNGRAPTSPTSIVPSHTIHPNAQRTSRSPPPQLRLNENGDRPALPPDAFYFSGSGGKSPTSGSRPTSINGRPNSMLGRPGSTVGRPGSIVGRPGSIAGAADLVRELKAREVEADNAKRREAAMRVILSRAIQQGFVLDEEASVDPPLTDMLGENPAVRQVAEALVQLKQEKANLQNEVASQIKIANDRLLEAERLQKGALHEAAFYRAKSAALDNGSTAELKRVEADRIADLEHQLDSTVVEYEKNKTELERMQAELGRHVDLSTSASEREADTLKRAEQAEEENARLHEEIEELQERTGANDRAVRDHTERFITLSSANQQREAERDEYKNQLETALNKHNEYLTIIEQTQGSITAAGVRAAELETLHGKAKDQVSQLEQELAEARRQLEDKTREAEQASQRLAEVETLHNTTREEANSLRTVTNGHLGQLLEIHRTTRGDEERAIKGHQEQLRALEEEKSSLLKLLREAGQRVDDTEAVASSHRQKARELESSHQNLRSEMRTHRTKLLNVQNEMSKYRGLYATKDAELRDRDQAVTELQTRVVLLRKMMGDHGIVVTDAELNNAELPSTSELETKLRDKARAHENAEREIEELTRRCREAEDKAESLTRHVDRINATRSGSSASMRSGSPGTHNVTEARALEAERKVQELEEKLSVVESDYQTAVRYVKGTEKMLNRMKNELNKQKATNSQLSTELDGLRGRSGSVDPAVGLRSVSGGRSTPSEGELSRRLQTMQTQFSNVQAELQASQDVLSARNREVEVLRMRIDDTERESEMLREDLGQAQRRIATLLEMNQSGIHLHSDDEDEHVALRRGSSASSDGATSMAFDKFTKELKQWERARSPDAQGDSDEMPSVHSSAGGRSASRGGAGALNGMHEGASGSTANLLNGSPTTAFPISAAAALEGVGHSRSSSAYSGDWTH